MSYSLGSDKITALIQRTASLSILVAFQIEYQTEQILSKHLFDARLSSECNKITAV